MPIEVFPGKTGDRLIARIPVDDGSFARIRYQNGRGHFEFRASYQGGSAGGYAALSPDLFTLDQAIARQIEDEKSVLVHNNRRFLDDKKYPLPDYARTREAAEETLEMLKGIVPVLSSIKAGSVLSVIVPSILPTRFYRLGKVTTWEIFNA